MKEIEIYRFFFHADSTCTYNGNTKWWYRTDFGKVKSMEVTIHTKNSHPKNSLVNMYDGTLGMIIF